jgi:hypothetical protein
MAQVQFKYISTWTKDNGKVDYYAVPKAGAQYTSPMGKTFEYRWIDIDPNVTVITLDDVTDEKAVHFIRYTADLDGNLSFEEL